MAHGEVDRRGLSIAGGAQRTVRAGKDQLVGVEAEGERAFASLLTRDEEGRHWLVTPECRQSIEVEDAAFVAVDMKALDDALAFRLNTDELVLAGPDHPLRAAGDRETPAIYLAVRRGCEARLDRSTWLQLAEHALATGDGSAVASQGASFALVPA